MFTASAWARHRAQEEALLMNSTRAGQNVINGVRRPRVGVVPPTKSNPQGVAMVTEQPKVANPLITRTFRDSSSKPLGNGIRLKDRSRYSPLTATFGDCIKAHGVPASEE